MSTLKSLMSQRKAAARLDHPYAKYDHAGKLSCSICGTQLKHENLWSAHLVSKQHRVNVQSSSQSAAAAGNKRKRDDASDADQISKRTKEDEKAPSASGLPADFFDRPSDAAAVASSSTTAKAAQQATNGNEQEEDPEWAAFEAELSSAPTPSQSAIGGSSSSGLRLPPVLMNTAGATLSAKPVEYEFGAPKVSDLDEEAQGEGAGAEGEQEQEEETEEERRERLDREEREEMLERINEEERAQQEADERVTALQRKLQRIKEIRQQRQQSKTTTKPAANGK